MGEEMAESQSVEITKVMNNQGALEAEYARLVTERATLKGISNKKKLQDIKEEILVSYLNRLTVCRESPRTSRRAPSG